MEKATPVYVNHDEFRGRNTVVDERFARGKERLEDHAKTLRQVSDLTIQMGEILKRYDETMRAHEKRICTLEREPADRYARVKMAFVTALVSGSVGYMISAILSK